MRRNRETRHRAAPPNRTTTPRVAVATCARQTPASGDRSLSILALAGLAMLLAVALTSGARAAAAAEPASVLSPALQAADKRLAAVHDLRARFRQEKHIALLKRPLVSSGRVLMRDGRVLWQTEAPLANGMLVDAGEIRMYDPGANRLEVYRVEQRFSDMAASPVPRLATLAESFDLEEVQDPDFLVLRLTPRTDLLREQLDEATLSLSLEQGHVTAIEIVDHDGDRTHITFTDVEINQGLDPAELELDMAPGTEIVTPQGGAH